MRKMGTKKLVKTLKKVSCNFGRAYMNFGECSNLVCVFSEEMSFTNLLPLWFHVTPPSPPPQKKKKNRPNEQ